MRSDKKRFRLCSELKKSPNTDLRFNDDGSSHSGNQRNYLFLATGAADGRGYEDVTAISGLEDRGDSRTFALWDLNRDGWQDVAIIATNNPMLTVYRNEMGTLAPETGGGGGMIAVRLVGGNRSAAPTSEWSSRDAFGARLHLDLGDRRLLRDLSCGEGRAAQNSSTLVVGIGAAPTVPSLAVRWPSGRQQELRDLPAGSLVTVYEDPDASPDDAGFTLRPYGDR